MKLRRGTGEFGEVAGGDGEGEEAGSARVCAELPPKQNNG